MREFHKTIDYSNRASMIDFLKKHFRYNTMNSWNRGTSYANCMKIYSLGFTRKQEDKLWNIMQCDDSYSTVNILIDEFNEENEYLYQAAFNGRSGGYLVLYNGGIKELDYKSRCVACGQLNFRAVEETGCTCGRCRQETRVNLKAPLKEAYIKSGGIDDNEEFEEWSNEMLVERCELVERFDLLCDEIVDEALRLVGSYTIVEETEYIPKTKKVLKEVATC